NINKGLKETDFDAYFNEEVNLIELDNINLLYVACTRPSERLYVISKKAVGNNISGNIVPAIEKHPLWNKEDQRLLLGEKTMHAKQQDEDKSCTDTEIAEMPSAPWQGRIHFAAGRGEATPYCGEEKRKFGKLLHSALSHINTKEDAEKAIGLMYATAPALPDALKKAEETITAMMQDERIVAFFRSGVKVLNETELLMPGSEHLLRPDRIILDENSTEVVDFKTGHPHEAHKQQVKEYMNALQQAGHPQVKGYLIYTESMKVIQV
ncbi:MAG: PD-(D/E)XK nuclease family protein, partial [Flavobacteriales bacterium]